MLLIMQFLIEFLIYSLSKLKTQWQVPKEGVGVKPVLFPPVSGISIEMPSKRRLLVCPFHTRSLPYFLFLLVYSKFLFLPMLELNAILGVWGKFSIH